MTSICSKGMVGFSDQDIVGMENSVGAITSLGQRVVAVLYLVENRTPSGP